MYSVGDCNLTCVDAKKFIYTTADNETVFNITDIYNFENQKYCIQLGCLNGDSTENLQTLGINDLKDHITSYYYDQQLIENEYIGYHILEDLTRLLSDNEDVFLRQHYNKYHMNYHYNTRYTTEEESPNADNDFKVIDPDKISKISIGKYYVDSNHFEFYSRYRFDKHYTNFHYEMVIQLGVYFVIFDFQNNVKLRVRFGNFNNGKFDEFYSKILYDFSGIDFADFAINFENRYGISTRITLSINDNTTYAFEIEEFLVPYSYCSIISEMYVRFRGYNLITVRSNFDEDSRYIFGDSSCANKLLKYTIDQPAIQAGYFPNIILNIGCKYNLDDENGLRNIETRIGKTQSHIPLEHLLFGEKLNLYEDKTLNLQTHCQSVLIRDITLIDQSGYIKSIVEDDTSNNYHALRFTADKQYFAFYKYQWNDIRSCYGFKERFTLKGLELFRKIEAYSAKYSIYGLNLIVSPQIDNILPDYFRIKPDVTGNEFQTTNIIPLSEIDDVNYLSSKSYRHIEIHGTLKDLRTKLNITDESIKTVYLSGISIIFIENNQYYELSSNANHTLKTINLDEQLPIVISIEF